MNLAVFQVPYAGLEFILIHKTPIVWILIEWLNKKILLSTLPDGKSKSRYTGFQGL